MVHTIVCLGCERVSDGAVNALRRHATQMNTAFGCVRKGSATEEQVSNFRGRPVASFNEAQLAWDAYREHLAEHGLLPPRSKLPMIHSVPVSWASLYLPVAFGVQIADTEAPE